MKNAELLKEELGTLYLCPSKFLHYKKGKNASIIKDSILFSALNPIKI